MTKSLDINRGYCQGVPILINRAMASEEGPNRLIDVSIEKASLAGNILNSQTIHEA